MSLIRMLPCPRRSESSQQLTKPEQDHWRSDGTCSYCGGHNPEEVLRRIEAGTVEVIPTDKSYKIYVRNCGGAPFTQRYRNCPYGPGVPTCPGPEDCVHWTTREVQTTRVFFQHFTMEQQDRFVTLLNSGKVKIGMPGFFYVLPFFVGVRPT